MTLYQWNSLTDSQRTQIVEKYFSIRAPYVHDPKRFAKKYKSWVDVSSEKFTHIDTIDEPSMCECIESVNSGNEKFFFTLKFTRDYDNRPVE